MRLPDGMRDHIAAFAKKNGRSMNAEIVARLQYTFEVDKANQNQGFENAPLNLPDNLAAANREAINAMISEALEPITAKLLAAIKATSVEDTATREHGDG